MIKRYLLLVSLVMLFAVIGFVSADPNGANYSDATNERGQADSPEEHAAIAGNVTELMITGYTITQSWQGYFGNVTGTIELTDGSDNTMYNWSVASPSGEVFASEDNNVDWTSIDCFNWTANGTEMEELYNINGSADGINETFKDSNSHAEFFVGSTSFSAGECMSTDIFDSTKASSDGTFEEVLLWDGDKMVFASLLEDDVLGFDNAAHDFEMLVVEDGHLSDTETTDYYFYVELE